MRIEVIFSHDDVLQLIAQEIAKKVGTDMDVKLEDIRIA